MDFKTETFRFRMNLILHVIVASILFLTLTSFKPAADPIGEIKFMVGTVKITRNGEDISRSVRLKSPIYRLDQFETKSESRCELLLKNGSIVRLAQNSLFKVTKARKSKEDERNSFSLFFGKLWVKAQKLFNPTDEFSVHTPTAVAAVRGTEFQVSADSNRVKVLVSEGEVDCGTAEPLTNFDSFVDFLKREKELFEKWKKRNSGEEFYNNEYKAFKSFIDAEQQAYQDFLAGRDATKKAPEKWIKSVKAGNMIEIEGNKRTVRKYTDADLQNF